MLIAQDFIWFVYLLRLTLDCQFGCVLTLSCMLTWLDLHLWCQGDWDSRFFENSDLFEFPSFSPKVFLKLLSSARPFFHSAFFFQIRKHISDAMCHAMYDRAWMKCLCIRFTFMVFSFIKFANFSPMHPLRACWCSLFLLCPIRDFCLDSCLLHRISFFVLGNKNHSCSSLYVQNTCFFSSFMP